MTSSRLPVSTPTIWYVLWSAMLLIAAGNALLPRPVFSGNLGLIATGLLTLIAGIQILLKATTLPRKEAALSAVLLIIFCFGQLIVYVRTVAAPPTVGVDFSAYYIAAKLVSTTPAQSLYQLPFFPDGRMNLLGVMPLSSAWQAAASHYHVPFAAPYIYPPFCAVLIKPLARLSFASALAAWNLAMTLLTIAALLISLSLAGIRLRPRLALILAVGLFSYYPFAFSLLLGQIAGLIFFLLAAGIWLLTRNRVWPSALCFALATLIKLTPVLAVPILVLHRRWKWLFAYAVCIVSLLLFSIWQAGWIAHQQFLREVLPSISLGAPVYTNSSLVALVQELFLRYVPTPPTAPLTIPPYAGAASRLAAELVFCVMLVRFYLRRRDGDLVRDLVIMLLLGIVISPVSWLHHYTLALLPFLYLWRQMPENGRRTLLVLFIAVSTNVIGIVQFAAKSPILQLVLAAIIPCLTIAVAYLALAPRQEPSIPEPEPA